MNSSDKSESTTAELDTSDNKLIKSLLNMSNITSTNVFAKLELTSDPELDSESLDSKPTHLPSTSSSTSSTPEMDVERLIREAESLGKKYVRSKGNEILFRDCLRNGLSTKDVESFLMKSDCMSQKCKRDLKQLTMRDNLMNAKKRSEKLLKRMITKKRTLRKLLKNNGKCKKLLKRGKNLKPDRYLILTTKFSMQPTNRQLI